MKKLILLGAAFAALSFAAVKDSDLDGVPDNLDQCPNTPFLATVNKNGCSNEQLLKKNPVYKYLSKVKYYTSAGFEYDRFTDSTDAKTLFASISGRKDNYILSYYFSLQSIGDGFKSNDSILSFYYDNIILNETKIKIGAKLYLPTTYNDKLDYAFKISASTYFEEYKLTLSEKHKIYGESWESSKDTIMASVGKRYKKYYISPYAYIENSPYNTSDWSKYIGASVDYLYDRRTDFLIDVSTDIEELSNITVIGSIGYSF